MYFTCHMSNQLVGINRLQMQMSSLEDCISTDNPARLIEAFVEKLDLKQLGVVVECKNKTIKGGRPSYTPTVFLKLYLYGYLNKIRSSRKLEQECHRNVELHWLLQYLTPNYHTIADFRKDNAEALTSLFRLYVSFMDEMKLLGKETIAIDGTKLRAVNSSKNNYNQKKIDKHQQLIAEKAATYLTEMDRLDKTEAQDLVQQYRKEEVEAGLQVLNSRIIKYDELEQRLQQSEDKQISTTDTDSRTIIINKNIVEVAYNTQCAVDAKHNLIVHCQATNTNDGKALHQAAAQAKENLRLQKEDTLTVLADKGYHTGAELHECHKDHMTTYVAYKEQPGVKHIAREFLAESFAYAKAADSYTCPAGAVLTSLGTWHNKQGEANETSYRFKTYRTEACKTCVLKDQCTKLPRRIIQRSEYQDAVDINDNNIKNNPGYYKRRQAICEHPFGTIKRGWGYSFTLLKGLGKVDGEMNLIMLCYNIKRTINILGFERLLAGITKWAPDYKKVLCAFKILIYKDTAKLNMKTKMWIRRNYTCLQGTALNS